MKRILQSIILVSIIVLLGFLPINSYMVSAKSIIGDNGEFNKSLNNTAAGTGHAAVTGDDKLIKKDPLQTIGLVINALLGLLGIFFLVLIIYSGYIWMLARGNDSEVTKAKNIMQNAIIGLIVVLAAYAITAFVGSILSGTTTATPIN